MAFAAAEHSPVPAVHMRNEPRAKLPGAIAYPIIDVRTTNAVTKRNYRFYSFSCIDEGELTCQSNFRKHQVIVEQIVELLRRRWLPQHDLLGHIVRLDARDRLYRRRNW